VCNESKYCFSFTQGFQSALIKKYKNPCICPAIRVPLLLTLCDPPRQPLRFLQGADKNCFIKRLAILVTGCFSNASSVIHFFLCIFRNSDTPIVGQVPKTDR
jgi:hypothetical protein